MQGRVLPLEAPATMLRFLLLCGPIQALPILALVLATNLLIGASLPIRELVVVFLATTIGGYSSLLVLTYIGSLEAEQTELERSLMLDARKLKHAVASALDDVANVAGDLASLAETIGPPEPALFHSVTAPIHAHLVAAREVAWLPRVADTE